ncbi:MAG: kinase [Lachnospiraceae bacterium]|nr:kinase [Lachnospiraceae bacterium]MDD3796170.1 kinase [Lachnospiraceae bacterium]
MQKLIILRGNSGSGKTTIAKELQKRFGRNTMLISQDMIRREMLRVKDGENTLAVPLMKELLIYGKEHSEIVILEGIMYADWYRSLFELAVQLYDTRVYAYYFDLPFEETLKRHQTKVNYNDFGEDEMRRWWREKDFSDVLNEISITSDKEKESIVSEIYNFVFNE